MEKIVSQKTSLSRRIDTEMYVGTNVYARVRLRQENCKVLPISIFFWTLHASRSAGIDRSLKMFDSFLWRPYLSCNMHSLAYPPCIVDGIVGALKGGIQT